MLGWWVWRWLGFEAGRRERGELEEIQGEGQEKKVGDLKFAGPGWGAKAEVAGLAG